jgi:peptidoglycan/xylan/chitin deacetylase (PgdA/CDA1 family)
MPGERKPGQDNPYYDWSPIVKRHPLKWPGDARVAIVIILNLEHWDWLPADSSQTPSVPLRPDPINYSQHEYGNRVGVFRIFGILDKYGMKPTIAMDKQVAEHYPFLVHECQKRELEFIAHGISARQPIQPDMSPAAERAYVRACVEAVTKATGKRPVGWLGPGFQESTNTPAILAAEGVNYVCDWSNDEQPYRMKVSEGELFSLGVDYDLDDVYIHMDGHRLIDEYRQIIEDTFDRLYDEGARSGRLMVVNIHPWVLGWPWRSKYLDRALAYINGHSGVWNASGREVVEWYKAHASNAFAVAPSRSK